MILRRVRKSDYLLVFGGGLINGYVMSFGWVELEDWGTGGEEKRENRVGVRRLMSGRLSSWVKGKQNIYG